ncbi:MAG: hypothetical protein CMG46_02085 [Candidatus Marinimicrobia bacterium]|nr:hypothetical protein [Candidatus Neomarinimicrobiota bacterium]
MLIYYLCTIICTYHIFNILEYILHKLSHKKYMGRLYRWHHIHHTKEFPVTKLVNNEFISPPIYENIFLQIALIILIGIYPLLTSVLYSIISIEVLLLIKVDDYLHMAYHRDNSYLERYNWFRYAKHQHHLHHINTRHNFNIFNNNCDILLNTIKY